MHPSLAVHHCRKPEVTSRRPLLLRPHYSLATVVAVQHGEIEPQRHGPKCALFRQKLSFQNVLRRCLFCPRPTAETTKNRSGTRW